jgi:hypothetical protein
METSLLLTSLDFDFLGTVCILQSVDSLLETITTRRHGAHHDRARPAAQTVFEQACQFAVTLGDEHALFVGVAECVDTVGQGEE